VMRPGERPLAELSRILARAVPESGGEDTAPWIADALERLPAGERLVLAVDQFEEVFVACRDEAEREAFLDALVEGVTDPDERLVVVLAIRADFYGRCAEHADLSTLISANQVLVGPMRRDELRRAIELPARRAGLRVEPRLVSALVGDVAGEPGGLPLLSAALLELWQHRNARTLRHRTYERTGGVEGAVARLAEDAYQRLDADERRRARPLLLRLAGDDDEGGALVRRRVSLDELEVDRDEETAGALAVLTESRLLTVDDGTVEVAHEALLREWPRLRRWLEEDAEGRRLHQHLIGASQEWRGSGSDPAELYRGARLASALDWAAEHDPELNELEREFLEESRVTSEREAERQRRTNRRLRSLLVGVGVLLTVAVVAGLIARSERQSARDAARVEAAQRLGAQALNEGSIDRAVRLAGAGVALDDSIATRGNLLAALLHSPPAALGMLGGSGDAEVYGLAVSPDGRLLAAGDGAGTVTIFDAASREVIGRYQLGDAPGGGLVQTLTFSPDGETLAVTGQEPPNEPPGALVDLIDTGTLERRVRVVLPPFPDPAPLVFASAAFQPNGRDLVVMQTHPAFPNGPASVVRRIDGTTGDLEGAPLRVGRHAAFGLSQTSDRRRVFVTSEGDVTYEIDARTLRVVRRYPAGGRAGALSADGTTLALGSQDGTVRLLDVRSGRVRRLAGRHEAAVANLALTPDTQKLVTSDGAGDVIVWDVAKGEIDERLSAHRGVVWGLTVSPDGRTLYSSASDGLVILWDLSGDRRLLRSFPVDTPFGDDDTPRGIAVSPDGRTLAVTHGNGAVDLIDTATLRHRGRVSALQGFAAAVGFSPDGRLLAVAGEGGRVTLWNARTLAPAGELRGLPADSQALAFSPDGKLLAAAVNTGRPVLRVWNVPRRELTAGSKTLAGSLDFSPDGELIAAAALEGGTEIRDADSGKLVERLPTEGLSRSVAFSPDGSLLAVGQYDGVGRLYSTESWRPLGGPLQGHTQRVTYVTFSADGATLATASADGTVGLWDVETQRPIGPPLTVEPDTFTSAAFSPNGSHLFAVSTRGPGISLDTDPEAWRRHACTVAGGGLTPEEWEEMVPEQDYVSVCPSDRAG
jgi:WD40 repeat protein